ncbi:MAG: glucosaminidase domain-containing protein [Bacteroidales bacterium]
MKIRYILVILVFSAACSSTRTPVKPFKAFSAQQYVNEYKDLAIQEMKRTGIPASITLAQGILESNYGNSRLATEGNNHFGIKCHSEWNGNKIYHDDDRRNECFRKYDDVYQSYKDHSRFLTSRKRYAFLFDYDPSDYKKWARGLKKAGYATSSTYASKLINLIERYELHQYDSNRSSGASASSSSDPSHLGDVDNYRISPGKHKVRMRNRVDYIKVKEGDTFKSLNEELNLLPWELKKYNELDDGDNLEPGQVLYLQPKRNKAEKGYDTHIVKEDETMYSISQLYGIKLDKLYEKNHMEKGEEPETGQKIWLRKKKPKDAE